MARQLVLISYDIADPKRLNKVFKACQRYGDALQYSVFCGTLSDSRRAEAVAELDGLINHDEDRILILSLGPDNERTRKRFLWLGRQGELPTIEETLI